MGLESFSLRPLHPLEKSRWIQDCVGFRMCVDVVGGSVLSMLLATDCTECLVPCRELVSWYSFVLFISMAELKEAKRAQTDKFSRLTDTQMSQNQKMLEHFRISSLIFGMILLKTGKKS
jgi:hypothetical protein